MAQRHPAPRAFSARRQARAASQHARNVAWAASVGAAASESEHVMDEQWASYPYQRFTITTFRAEGVWWARARVAEKDVGGDRPVTGGPWRNQRDAKSAAEVFCKNGQAGSAIPDAEVTPA